MSPGPNVRTIMKINLELLYAVVLAVLAWLCWPETAEYWGFGLVSILFGAAAAALVIRNIWEIWLQIMRDIAVGRFNRQGREPQSDGPGGDDALRDAGMIE